MRSAIASATSLKPRPCSASPGIGNVRGTAPSAITSRSYSISNVPPSVSATTVLAVGVSADRSAEEKLGVLAHLPQRNDDVTRLERRRRSFGEERRVEHEVVGVDDRRAPLAEQAGDVRAGETTADDQGAATRLPSLHSRHAARNRLASVDVLDGDGSVEGHHAHATPTSDGDLDRRRARRTTRPRRCRPPGRSPPGVAAPPATQTRRRLRRDRPVRSRRSPSPLWGVSSSSARGACVRQPCRGARSGSHTWGSGRRTGSPPGRGNAPAGERCRRPIPRSRRSRAR